MTDTPSPARGLTPRELARFLRVSADRVRALIRAGKLGAINTAAPGQRARFVVLPQHLDAYVQTHAAAPPAAPRRPRRKTTAVDYYP